MFKSLYKETEGFRLVSILTPLCMIGTFTALAAG